ncbi:helix-turn-helix domain-containing protein [Jatrophihabitans sp.]|uniref:helix-turn-helix transcriptional regulator n=1 Tax=Jatrophihabitans sp. TaxID=1932789 RepID=UPI0030C6A991|nr:regulatory protein MerR [Jatrophihabitans sp.]
MSNEHDLHPERETAEQLRISHETLRVWRRNGTGPKSFRVGRRVMYRQADIDTFINEAYDQAGVN